MLKEITRLEQLLMAIDGFDPESLAYAQVRVLYEIAIAITKLREAVEDR